MIVTANSPAAKAGTLVQQVTANSPAAKAGTLVQQVTQADEVGCSMDIFDRALAGEFGRPLRHDSSTDSVPPISDEIFRTPSRTHHGQILQTPTSSEHGEILKTPSITHHDEICSTPAKLDTPASSFSPKLSSSQDLGQSEEPTTAKIWTRGIFGFAMPTSELAAMLAPPEKKIVDPRGTASPKKKTPVRKTTNATKSTRVKKRMDGAEKEKRRSYMCAQWKRAYAEANRQHLPQDQARIVADNAYSTARAKWEDLSIKV